MKNQPNNMNIFEDLIDELKEENLIEETVIKTAKAKRNHAESAGATPKIEVEAVIQPAVPPEEIEPVPPIEIFTKPTVDEAAPKKSSAPVKLEPVKLEPVKPAPPKVAPPKPTPAKNESSEEVDFYRKRAMDEVAFLQMVESAFAGVERDQMKIVPTFYDDLEVKKVLHSYLQVAPKASSSERSQAEFLLLQATENWYSTLAERDKRIMTAHLRRYCETSRPPLSMPALIALARFYRNSPYSESVRSKFDLMLTRIFSQEAHGSRRELGFSREELVGYVKELYAEWSSVPMYSTEPDDEGLRQTIAQFEDFIKEANAAATFDGLINGNFFNRLRTFKESTNEDFYAPQVAAVSIELNVHIGNRYVELLEREKEKDGIETVGNKYGLINDNVISEATSKTMMLVELLNQKQAAPPQPVVEEEYVPAEPLPPPVKPETEVEKAVAKNTKYAKWSAMAVVLFIIAVSAYFIVGSLRSSESEVAAAPVNMERSMLKEYLRDAKVEDEVLSGVVLPTWEKLSSEAKKQALKTMLSFGGEKGFHKIELYNQRNEKVGIADDTGIFVVE